MKAETNTETGKISRHLRFEEEIKPQGAHIKGPLLTRPVKTGANAAIDFAHKKIHEVEHENVGTEAFHKGERIAEDGLRSAYRYKKTAPYRKVARLEKKAAKASARATYQQALQDNPKLRSNMFSRMNQKRKIKRQYAKTVKEAKKTLKRGSQTKKTASKTVNAVRRHPAATGAIVLLVIMVVSIFGNLASCSVLLDGGMFATIVSTYPSDEADMLAVEAAYSAMEADLQYKLDNFETQNPGYDEYNYELAGIFHDPHELAAYLSAKYVAYTLGDVRQELRRIFNMQYELSVVETIETRYREETKYDPDTGESSTVSVPYEYKIVTVTLKNNGLSFLALAELTADQLEVYQVYRETLGNMPLIFGGGSTNTNPSADLGGVQFINGERPGNQNIVDIALSQVGNVGGYPYWSWYGFNGRVAWCACFVSWCINQAGYSEPFFAYCPFGINWFAGRGQWGNRNYASIAPGDLIFFDWNGDGVSDHVGIVIGTDGAYVYTVEGNSGDACKVRSYPVGSSVIQGYGLMNW